MGSEFILFKLILAHNALILWIDFKTRFKGKSQFQGKLFS